MHSASRFALNGSRIIHEEFENEVVIVNLDTGRYYCLQGAGADVWRLMAAGRSAEEVATALAERYTGASSAIADALHALFRELQEQELIVAADARPPLPIDLAAPAGGARPPFVAPRLQTYTDMQDLLVLDPIHEVDPEGWPVMRAEEKGKPQ